MFFDKNLFFFLKNLEMYIFSYISSKRSNMNGHQCQSERSRTKANGLSFSTGRLWIRADSMKVNDHGRLDVDGLENGTLS